MEDVTGRKRAEQELAGERNLLRTLIDSLPDSVFFKDVEGRFVTANASLVRALGTERPDEVVGRTDFDFLPRELAERFQATESEIVRSGKGVVNREESIDRGYV